MKAKENFGEKENIYSYLNYINRDSWFLKSQLIFAGILLVILLLYILMSA